MRGATLYPSITPRKETQVVTRIILAVVGIFAACFMIGAIVAVVVGSRSIPVTDPTAASAQQTAAANAGRAADNIESLATEIPDAIRDSEQDDSSSGEVFTLEQVGKVLGVNPEYLQQDKKYHNMWYFSPPEPASVTLKSGWRGDLTNADYEIHSCSDIEEPGIYGTKDGVEVVVVRATLLYVPGETKCPPFTTWGRTHRDDSADTGSSSNAATGSDTEDESDNASSSEEADDSDVGGDSNVASAQTEALLQQLGYELNDFDEMSAEEKLEIWRDYIERKLGDKGIIHGSADQYGGYQVELFDPWKLPNGLEAYGGPEGRDANPGERLDPSEWWRIYPPCSIRDSLDLAGQCSQEA